MFTPRATAAKQVDLPLDTLQRSVSLSGSRSPLDSVGTAERPSDGASGAESNARAGGAGPAAKARTRQRQGRRSSPLRTLTRRQRL